MNVDARAPIRNSAHVVERDPADGEQAHRAREVIRRQSDHLTRPVDDLLDMTRVSRGWIALHRRHGAGLDRRRPNGDRRTSEM